MKIDKALVKGKGTGYFSDDCADGHACVFVMRTGSCGIEKLAFTDNGRGKRGPKVQAAVELFACPDKNVGGPADAPKQAVRTLGETSAKGCMLAML